MLNRSALLDLLVRLIDWSGIVDDLFCLAECRLSIYTVAFRTVLFPRRSAEAISQIQNNFKIEKLVNSQSLFESLESKD